MAGFAFNEAFSRDESAQDDHQAQIDARSVARQLNAQEEKNAFLHARSAASGADAVAKQAPSLLKAGAKPKPKPVAAIPAFMQRKRPAAGDGAAAAVPC